MDFGSQVRILFCPKAWPFIIQTSDNTDNAADDADAKLYISVQTIALHFPDRNGLSTKWVDKLTQSFDGDLRYIWSSPGRTVPGQTIIRWSSPVRPYNRACDRTPLPTCWCCLLPSAYPTATIVWYRRVEPYPRPQPVFHLSSSNPQSHLTKKDISSLKLFTQPLPEPKASYVCHLLQKLWQST